MSRRKAERAPRTRRAPRRPARPGTTPRRGRGQSRRARREARRSRTKPSRQARGASGASAETAQIAPRRARSRLWRVLVVALAVVSGAAVLVSGGEWALRTHYFRVSQVRVVGVHHESAAAVIKASGLSSHPAIIDVSSSRIRRDLNRFVWIKSVVVTKHWPDRVVLNVTERTPVAVAFNSSHQLQYVDVTGHDLGQAPLHANLPTLVYQHPLAKSWPFRVAGRGAALVASKLPRAFSSQVSEILVNAEGHVTLKMTTPVSFVLGPPTDLEAKFISIASVIAHARLAPGDVVDVSVPGSLAVTGGAPS